MPDEPRAGGLQEALPGEPKPVGYAELQPSGVWLCYYGDRSGFAVFPTEIEALRHAVAASMQVKFQEWGEVTT